MNRSRRYVRSTALAVLLAASAPSTALAAAGPAAAPAKPTYTCQGAPIDLGVLEHGRSATTLPANAQKALQSRDVGGIGNLKAWRVLSETSERIVVVHRLTKKERHNAAEWGTGRPTVGYVEIASEYTGGFGVAGWWYVYATACELRRKLGRLANLDATLDPAYPKPGPADTSIHLLVSEQNCASGGSPVKRIRVVDVKWTKHKAKVALGVRPPRGAQTCPGVPPAAYTLVLSKPLGNRTLVDSTVYPARAFRPGKAGSQPGAA